MCAIIRGMPARGIRFVPLAAAVLAALVILLPAVSAGASPPRSHAARLPVLATGSGHGAVRPTTIQYTGDGSGVIGKLSGQVRRAVGRRPGFLHWTVWTNTHASANGTVWLLSCRPDCADSPYYRYALRLTAGRVRNGHYTRMTLLYTYHGQKIADTRCVPDRRSSQVWGLVFRGRCE